MQSIPVLRSQWCKREGYLALDCFVHKMAPMGPGVTLGCPNCTKATRPKLLTQVAFFRGADVIKFTASLKWNPNSPPSLISLSVWHWRQSPASILLWGSNGNASQPSPSPTSCIYKWEHSSLPQIGDFVSTDQPFCLSMAEYGSEHIPFDGILGLNYPSVSSSGAIPIFDKLKNQGAISEPVFAFYLSK